MNILYRKCVFFGYIGYTLFKNLKINCMNETGKKIKKQLKNLATPRENKIETALVNLVLSYEGECKKLQGVGNKSWPDRFCLFPWGKVWFVETKKPGKKPDRLQLRIHTKLREMGFNVSVIWNAEQLKQFENDIQAT